VREEAAAGKKLRAEVAAVNGLHAGNKRKRSDLDEEDPKLKEYLELMQAPSKLKTLASITKDDVDMEPPTKMQALELPEGESDDEYEIVPKKAGRTSISPQRTIPATIPTPVPVPTTQPDATEETLVVTPALDATDDDWLRSRTNRLLDLMDPEDIAINPASAENESVAEIKSSKPVAETSMIEDGPLQKLVSKTTEQPLEEDLDKPDPTIEAIKSNGRLFVRNLPYSATEDDLRAHFAPFGTLEEV